jgi:23S rRNA-/tRNA-specific pseudouridylate synthase
MATKTTPLADDTIFKGIEDMKGSILVYNHGQNKGFKVSKSTLTGKNPRYSVVCATYQKMDKESKKNCKFSVCCRPVAGETHKWRVTKCSLNHSCTNDQKGRKRNYGKTVLASANIPVVSTTATPLADIYIQEYRRHEG